MVGGWGQDSKSRRVVITLTAGTTFQGKLQEEKTSWCQWRGKELRTNHRKVLDIQQLACTGRFSVLQDWVPEKGASEQLSSEVYLFSVLDSHQTTHEAQDWRVLHDRSSPPLASSPSSIFGTGQPSEL